MLVLYQEAQAILASDQSSLEDSWGESRRRAQHSRRVPQQGGCPAYLRTRAIAPLLTSNL